MGESDKGIWVIGYGSLIFKPLPRYQLKVNGYLRGFIRRFWQSSSDHRGTPESPGRVVTLVLLDDLKRNDRFHDDLYMYELRNRDFETGLLDELSEDTGKVQKVLKHVHDLVDEDLKVWGCAYYVAPEDVEEIKAYLDVREQDGYTTHRVPFHIIDVPDVSGSGQEVLNSLPRNESGDLIIESLIYIGTLDNKSFVGPEEVEDTANVIRHSKGPSGLNSEYLLKLCDLVRHLDQQGRSRDFYLEKLAREVSK